MKFKIKLDNALSKLRDSNKKTLFSIGFAVFGMVLLAITAASAAVIYFEAESSSVTGTATIESDGLASSGQFLKFGSGSTEVLADYFVATTGNDSNPGTESQPFKTIDKALSVVSAGEAIKVKSGTYTGDFEINVSGSSGNPITIMGESGTKLVTNKTQSDASVWIRADYIVFKDFDIEGNIHVRGHFNIIEDNYIHDSWEQHGIMLSASERNADDCTNNIVRNNEIFKTMSTGLYLEGQNNQMLNNEVSRIVDHNPDVSDTSDADGMRFFGSNHLVKGNYFHDIWQTDQVNLPHIDMMQTWQEAHDIVFDGNIMHNPNPDGSNRILMLARHAGAGPVSNLTWTNNIFIFSDDSSAFLNFNRDLDANMPEITNMTVVNNVFYSPNGLVEKAAAFAAIDNVIFKNNLVINTGLNNNKYVAFRDGSTDEGVSHNLIYNLDGSVPRGNPYPNDIWNVNPQIVDINGSVIEELDFRPTSGSPLIDAGMSHNYTDHDFAGILRPQGNGFDIGAFEFNE